MDKTSVNLFNRIHDDIDNCRTPDTASLRFNEGPILIFLWDDIADFKTMQQHIKGLDLLKGYRGTHYRATTKNKYLPWYNIKTDGDPDDNYWPAFCLEDTGDLEISGVPDYSLGEPLPIRGKLSEVSLDTLQFFDEYYDNQFSFERVLIDVIPSLYKPKEVIKAYTWFNSLEDICQYDTHKNQYKLSDWLDLTPFYEDKGVYTWGEVS